MTNLKNNFVRFYFPIFILAVFLLRMPPMYYLGMLGVRNILFTTHMISVIIFIFLFVTIVLKVLKAQRANAKWDFNIEIILILFFLFTQALSIVNAQNISIFLQRYSKIIIGFIVFIVARFLSEKVNFKDYYINFIIFFILGSFITLCLQFFILLFPTLYFNFANTFIYSNVFDITKANYNDSQKIFDDTYLEVVLPFLVYFFIKNRKNVLYQFFLFAMIILLGINAFFSNFRYRLITFAFSLLLSVYLFSKKLEVKRILVKIAMLLFGTLLVLEVVGFLLTNFGYSTILDRFTLAEGTEGFGTIKSRISTFRTSIDFANGNIFGVGLGNFYDNLTDKKSKVKSFFGPGEKTSIAALESGPHNIFFQVMSESGYIGLLSFIVLVLHFFYKDYKLLFKSDIAKEKIIFIVAFYSLILIVQFIPGINLSFYSLFFLLRGLI